MASNTSLPQQAIKHFVTIDQLSLRGSGTQTTPLSNDLSQPPAYATSLDSGLPAMLLFVLLFTCAMGIQVLRGARGARQIMTALVIALVIAGIPAVLSYVSTGGGQQAKAGPQEIPKEIRITYSGPQSAEVSWTTQAEAYGGIRYSPAPFTLDTSKFRASDSGKKSLLHNAIMDGLTPGTMYEVEVLSGARWYALETGFIRFTFVR